jgi:cystathionine gamma-lyase
MGDGTRVVHAGLPPPAQGKPFLPGPTFAAPFHLRGAPDGASYAYGRYGNPTLTAFEDALTELEGGPAVAFASGMAAVSAVLLAGGLRSGDVLVIPSDGYPGVRTLATDHLGPRGVEIRSVPTEDDAIRSALPGATLVWLETPSNPGLDTCDIAAVADAAHAEGALVAVDNTLATPLGQRPLELGADLSVAADTKGLTGHGDLLMGHVAAAERGRAAEILEWRTQTGAVPAPFETWLAHRSLATLQVRLERQCATALEVARLLCTRPEVRDVRHPGLPGDRAHAIAARQMTHFGMVVSFTVAGQAEADAFLGACELVAEATSFGGVHSSAERRARWAGNDVPLGLIRLSVGLEDSEDLRADITRALDSLGPASAP